MGLERSVKPVAGIAQLSAALDDVERAVRGLPVHSDMECDAMRVAEIRIRALHGELRQRLHRQGEEDSVKRSTKVMRVCSDSFCNSASHVSGALKVERRRGTVMPEFEFIARDRNMIIGRRDALEEWYTDHWVLGGMMHCDSLSGCGSRFLSSSSGTMVLDNEVDIFSMEHDSDIESEDEVGSSRWCSRARTEDFAKPKHAEQSSQHGSITQNIAALSPLGIMIMVMKFVEQQREDCTPVKWKAPDCQMVLAAM